MDKNPTISLISLIAMAVDVMRQSRCYSALVLPKGREEYTSRVTAQDYSYHRVEIRVPPIASLMEQEAPTTDQKTRILKLMREGNTLTKACQAIGVGLYQVFRWRQADPDFDRSYWSARHAIVAKGIADIDEELARPGLTRRQRRFLRIRKQAGRKADYFNRRLDPALSKRAGATETDSEKKVRRMKAVAKKILWLARKDFNSLSPEARRAAGRLLRSKLAGEILRAWGCETASGNSSL